MTAFTTTAVTVPAATRHFRFVRVTITRHSGATWWPAAWEWRLMIVAAGLAVLFLGSRRGAIVFYRWRAGHHL